MKKNRLFLLPLIALGMFFLIGCDNEETPPPVVADPPPVVVAPEPAPAPEPEEYYYEVDILVIGGGVAGLTAAIQAKYDGATNVAIVERSMFTGGVAISAFGGVNAAESRYQTQQEDYGTIEDMINTIMNPGVVDPQLVRTMVEASADSIHWFNDFLNAGFTELMPAWAHRPDVGPMAANNQGVGVVLVDSLNQGLLDLEIPVLLNTLATEVLVDESGAVRGATVERNGEELTILANAVIIAAGPPVLTQNILRGFDPSAPGYGLLTTPLTNNSGWELAYNAGGSLFMALRPFAVSGIPNTDYSIELFEAGGLMVNRAGELIIDVLTANPSEIVTAVQESVGSSFFVIFNEEMSADVSTFSRYYDAEILVAAPTLEELAEELEMDVDTLKETVDFAGPFFAAPGTAMAPATSAGIRINEHAQVLNSAGNPVPGLFASGVGVGGVQGYGRGGGMSLMEATVFGRISGASAAAFNVANFSHTAPTIPYSDELIFAATIHSEGGAEVEIPAFDHLEDGVFEGYARGYLGNIYVEVEIEDGLIISVRAVRHSETALYMMMANAGVPGQFLELPNTGGVVDAVSGATSSSVGIIEAVLNALGLE